MCRPRGPELEETIVSLDVRACGMFHPGVALTAVVVEGVDVVVGSQSQ